MTEKLRIGIAGMVNDHVWFMADATHTLNNAILVSASDPNEELRTKAAGLYGIARTYASYTEMMDSEDLDAVMICSDNAEKAPIVAAAAARGLHCWIDKPMSAFLSEADEIVQAVRGAGIKAMVGYHFKFGAAYRMVQDWIVAGRIGQVYLATASIGHAGPREINLSKYFVEWLEDRRRAGGGAWADEISYMISAMVDILGPITDVSAMMAQQGWRDYLAPDIEDNSVAIIRFESGALGMLASRWGQIGRLPHMQTWHGTDGTIEQGYAAARIFSRRDVPANMLGWLDAQIPPEGRGMAEAAFFVDTVLAGGSFEGVLSVEGSREVQAVIEAGYLSARRGQVIKVAAL